MKKVFDLTISTEEGDNIFFAFVAELENGTITMPSGFDQMVAEKLERNYDTF